MITDANFITTQNRNIAAKGWPFEVVADRQFGYELRRKADQVTEGFTIRKADAFQIVRQLADFSERQDNGETINQAR